MNVVAIHGKGRNQQRTIWRAVENGGPGTAWMVALIGVHLGV
jgi:hypothetical protein